MSYPLKRLLLAAILVEGSLAILSWIWAEGRGLPFGGFAPSQALIGIAATLPLLALLIATDYARTHPLLRSLAEFRSTVLEPIALALDWKSALLLSILAGVGEEFFFRGVLQQELGLIISSALFAGLHFGTALRKFLTVAGVYFAVSLYLGLLFVVAGSVWAPMITHILYDLIALNYIRLGAHTPSHTAV